MNIFEQLRSGADVNMATPEYAEAIKHMTDCANISLHFDFWLNFFNFLNINFLTTSET